MIQVVEQLPRGWRWETSGRVQLAVPRQWGYGTTNRQWCSRPKNEQPFVGRPGALTMLGCAEFNEQGQIGDTALGSGGQFVWFHVHEDGETRAASEREQLTSWVTEGDRVTFELAGQRIAIQAPAPLREEILETVRVVEVDENGCPVAAPFQNDQQWRPRGAAVTEMGEVRSVSACRYGGAQLASSVKVSGAKAARAIQAIAAAPKGGGPYTPAANCSQPEDLVAMEQIVLMVDAAESGMIGLRWDGCRHRGLDDGTTVRRLTRAAVLPFVSGPNRITSWTGGSRMARILLP
ncbi:hypothetical protein LWF15_12445 [Kineosporia rhizophila]|uniref:hypothetical protein n=1 Tax=Kineosporia rhizophila TaxID=84633 RepID=UPI001E54B376|nr:hypothetical protein [Kineosporia rhizophila]MCE0536319.1 hypothetical protein [Kineosporia rhizophila]